MENSFKRDFETPAAEKTRLVIQGVILREHAR